MRRLSQACDSNSSAEVVEEVEVAGVVQSAAMERLCGVVGGGGDGTEGSGRMMGKESSRIQRGIRGMSGCSCSTGTSGDLSRRRR